MGLGVMVGEDLNFSPSFQLYPGEVRPMKTFELSKTMNKKMSFFMR
jgi:hypothetical protein